MKASDFLRWRRCPLGCPVLASRVSSIPEVCQDAPFYFDPEDQGSFNRELLRAISDEEARKQAIERGREVAAQYSWEKCGQETLALYRNANERSYDQAERRVLRRTWAFS